METTSSPQIYFGFAMFENNIKFVHIKFEFLDFLEKWEDLAALGQLAA